VGLISSTGVGDTAPDRDAPRAASIGDYLLVAGKGQFATHALAQPAITIGRDLSCDVVIDDPILSRQHAVLRVGPPLTVQDLGSTNGVRVSGRAIVRGGAPIELAIGDGFHIGPFRAAKLLGVSRSTMTNRLRLYRIVRPRS